MRHALAALALLAAACDLFPNQGDGATTSDGGANGYGRPTLEVTIAGVHFGPSTPDPGSRVDYVNTRDNSTGRITDSTFQLQATSTKSGAQCAVAVHRAGDGVDPIHTGGWQVIASSFGPTPGGAVAVIGNQGVAVPQGTWLCSGASCNGAGFALTALDATHAEGYLAGTFPSSTGGGLANVVCSFYLPIGTFQP